MSDPMEEVDYFNLLDDIKDCLDRVENIDREKHDDILRVYEAYLGNWVGYEEAESRLSLCL